MKKIKNVMLTFMMFALILVPGYTVNATGETQTDTTTDPEKVVPVLSTLTVNGTDLIATDKCVDYVCDVEVPNDFGDTIVLEPTVDDAKFTLDKEKYEYAFDTVLGGLNGSYSITVTDKNDETNSKTYTVKVTRKEVIATLKSLIVKSGTEEFTPTFNEAEKKYTLTVPYGIKEVEFVTDVDEKFVTAETTSTTLGVGTTTSYITVKGNDDNSYVTSTRYTIVITRSENPLKAALEEALKDNAEISMSGFYDEGKIIYIDYAKVLEDKSVAYSYYEITFTDDSTVDSVLKDIEKAIAEGTDDVWVEPKDNKVTDSTIKYIKDNKIITNIDGHDATWTVDGNKVADTDKGFNTLITVGENVKEEIRNKIEKLLDKKDNGLIIDFAHSGALPKGTRVTVYVGDREYADQKLKLYYYNDKTGKLEEVKTKIETDVLDGIIYTVTFDLEHCSSYVLLPAKNNAKTGVLDVTLFGGVAAFALAGIALVLKKFN